MRLSAITVQAAPPSLADSLAKVTKKISSLPDSLSSMSPEKIHRHIAQFSWGDVISSVTSTGVTLALHIMAAVVVFIIGRYIIIKSHNLLRSIMLGRDVDPSLTTFLLSLYKITFFFILAIIVISILGIETSSFIALFASAGIALGMALSGTLQNFAGGVLILLLKPYRVGDFIEFETYKGVVKEIQIFNTIISTYNNESIIIPNGGLSTGTINNYSRERARRLEWRVGISYGDSVDRAREVILDIIAKNELLLKPGTEDDYKTALVEHRPDDNDQETAHGSWMAKWLRRNRQLKAKAEQWREEKRHEIEDKLYKIDYTPSVAVESLDDSAVTLVVRAWCTHENYWAAFYQVNEAIYKQLPESGVHFPFPQVDVHLDKEE